MPVAAPQWSRAAVLCAALAAAAPALAQQPSADDAETALADDAEAFNEPIRVYQRRPFMRKLRVEIEPTFSLAVSDNLYWQYAVGGQITFHVTDYLAIGASYQKYFRDERGAVDDLEQGLGVFQEKRFKDWYAGGHIAYVPLYGKFLLFDSAIVHFDASIIAGAGVMRTFADGVEGSNRVSWNVGLGSRLVATEWLTVNFQIRDQMYIDKFKSGDDLVNDVLMQVGLSFFLPFEYSYQYGK